MNKQLADDVILVRELAQNAFGAVVALSDTDKATITGALAHSRNVSINECVQAAQQAGIQATRRQLHQLRTAILQERMGAAIVAAKGGEG